MTTSAELLLHPVRLRVVQAFLGGRQLTTADLRAHLSDVPAATLYRQVSRLAAADVLEVAGERPVRGAVERTYRLREDRAAVPDADAAALTPEEQRAGFLAFVAALLADLDRWLAGAGRATDDGSTPPPPDPVRDGVGYRQAALHVADDELPVLAAALRDALAPWLEADPADRRPRRLLSTVLLPG